MSNFEKLKVREVIVVEGRDDTNAVLRAVDGLTIETHGFGIKKETWDRGIRGSAGRFLMEDCEGISYQCG